MTGLLSALLLAVLASVAVAGAMWPYRRGAVPALEPPADPLEDRRRVLLVSLQDLDAARDQGAVEEPEYERLREETESRMARVLRALDRRAAAGEAGLEATQRRSGPTARWVVVAAAAILALSLAIVPSLVRSLSERDPITDLGNVSSLEFFEQRVADSPHDVAARLDLAHRYLEVARFDAAYDQYFVAVELDPDNAEALAHLGILEHLAGRPAIGLELQERALDVAPGYPEALFFKGTILLRGLDRPEEAIEALEAYLEAAPFGSEGPQAEEFIKQAQREIQGN